MRINPEILRADKVELALRGEIDRLSMLPSAKLPQERALAERFGVSRPTVRRAIARLKRENLLYSAPGRGTFIRRREPQVKEIVLLCDSLERPLELLAVGLATEHVRQLHYEPRLFITRDPAKEWPTLETIRSRLGGVLICGSYSRSEVAALGEACRVPMVLLWDTCDVRRGEPVCDQVIPDSVTLGYSATKYLLDRGHRRIALLLWGPEFPWSRDKVRGYAEALAEAGVAFDERLIFGTPSGHLLRIAGAEPDPLVGEMRGRFEQCLAGGDPPTALVEGSGAEMQLRDVLHFCFRDHFPDDAILSTSSHELLRHTYTGLRPMTAIGDRVCRFVDRALELLLRPRTPGEPPRREFLSQLHVFRRSDGTWREERTMGESAEAVGRTDNGTES